MKVIMDATLNQMESEGRNRHKELEKLIIREKEIDALFEKIYEDNATGRLSDERYSKLSNKYEDETAEVKAAIRKLNDEIGREEGHITIIGCVKGVMMKQPNSNQTKVLLPDEGITALYLRLSRDVRFIAINDGVDSAKGEDDFTPFRNIMNEWYAKDMSRKMRSALKTKSQQGYAIGHPPMGYKYDEINSKRWVIDDEGAEIVRHIYTLRQQGTSINDIAKILKREKVLIPSVYAQRKGFKNPTKQAVCGECLWDTSMVRKLLMNQAYVGDVVNFRTYSKSFKLKERLDNPKENWEIHKNVHEPIIGRSVWEDIQKFFGNTKYRKPKHIEKNMFAGLMRCSDCGANLNYKYTHDNPDNHYFSCRNKRANNGLCSKTHHIRVDTITDIVTRHLSSIICFAVLFKNEFVKLVVDEHYKQIQVQQRRNQEALQISLAREKEVDVLYERLFEEKILGNLTEERFKKLSYKYEDEQAELKQKIKHLKKVVEEEQRHEMNADGFLQLVRKYTDIRELTPEILHEFVDKIVVHHKELLFGETVQKVEIYYKMIGFVELPEMSSSEKESYLKCFGRNEQERSA